MQEIIKTRCDYYMGGFTAICGQMKDDEWRKKRHQDYNNLVHELVAIAEDEKQMADDITLASNNSLLDASLCCAVTNGSRGQ
jgi:hypothetical protein